MSTEYEHAQWGWGNDLILEECDAWPESQPWQGERSMMCGCRKGDLIAVTMPDGTQAMRRVVSVTETTPGVVDVVLTEESTPPT